MQGFQNTEKKELYRKIFMLAWLLVGVAMAVMGVAALFNGQKTLAAISTALGVVSLLAAILITLVRIFQWRFYGSGKIFKLDGLIWLVAAILLFNTPILARLGKLLFIIVGILVIAAGIRSLYRAIVNKGGETLFVPGIIFSAVLILLGGYVVLNAQKLFLDTTAVVFGLFFIFHGASLILDWVGQVRYDRNFKEVEK